MKKAVFLLALLALTGCAPNLSEADRAAFCKEIFAGTFQVGMASFSKGEDVAEKQVEEKHQEIMEKYGIRNKKYIGELCDKEGQELKKGMEEVNEGIKKFNNSL